MTPAAQGELLGKILNDLDVRDIHLVGPDVGMAAAVSYALLPSDRLASLVVGHSVGTPGPLKLAMLINLMSRFGVLRWNTAILGAGPLIAFTSTEPTAAPTTMPVAAAPTPETVAGPAEDTTEAQDTASAETSANATDTTGSDSDANETSTSEGVVAEDATDEDMALAFVVCVREAGFDEMGTRRRPAGVAC